MISKLLKKIQLKDSRLSTKLIISYIFLTVIPLGLLGYMGYYQYTQSIEKQVGEYIPKLLNQANNNIENNISELDHLTEQVYSSSDVMSVLRDPSLKNQSQFHQDKFTIESFLSNSFLDNNSDILGAFLVSNNRSFVSTRLPYRGFNLENYSLPYGEEHVTGDKAQIFLPNQVDLKFDKNPPFILLMKPITDFDNRKNLGTLFLAVKITFIGKVLEDLENDKNAAMWVMDDSGQIIYHTDPSKIGSTFSELREYPLLNGSFQTWINKEPALISINESTTHHWILVHSIPLKYLTKSTDVVRNVTIIAFIVLVLIASFISIILAWSVTKPIKNLGRLMQDVEKGNLNVEIPMNSNDEVGVLAKSFHSMITRIRELIQKNYSIEIRQKNAELYALQSQINPHFMYNTLETISMAVEDGESEMVVDMVTLLGRMLRYSLSNKERLVPIKQEVQHIQDYLKIQKFRFEERLSFQIEEELDCTSYYTPKFILQPIVENAIKYGLEKRRALEVQIIVKEVISTDKNKDILFIIRDNGPGISKDILESLQNKLQSDPMGERESGFGILNVHARVMMMFGKQYEIKVNSMLDQGTVVTIQIPAISKGDVSHYTKQEELILDNGDN